MRRRQLFLLLFSVAIVSVSGCSWWNGLLLRPESPELADTDDTPPRWIGDIAVPFGAHPVRVDAVGLVTGLHGTGSDPGPSPQRSLLLEEMQKRGVDKPNAVLGSGKVSLVGVQGWLRPGAQKGDRFDIEIHVPPQSETTSLRGGYLLETRLQEFTYGEMDKRIHQGRPLALAKGPVLIAPTADSQKDRVLLCRGRILGGGVVLKSRTLGLALVSKYKDLKMGVATSSRIAAAINKRFHSYESGCQIGVAKAKTDQYVELTVHARYKDNIGRYFKVVRSIAIAEKDQERMDRITALQEKLLNPQNVEESELQEAALDLEAIGVDGAAPLIKALASTDVRARFYAAEALAYLDRREAAEPLGQIARDEPAFRVFALAALSTLQDFNAKEQLHALLSSPSAETRYGAFRALWAMNENDPFTKGEFLGKAFHLHAFDVGGPPMVHITRSRLPEIVLFGSDQRFATPLAVNAGNEIMVTSLESGDEISVSKFSVQDGDEKRTVSTRIVDVIRAIAELGGSYPDVVQTLQEAKVSGALPSRLEIDALPSAFRPYDEAVASDDVEMNENAKRAWSLDALPDLFSKEGADADSQEGVSSKEKDAARADDEDEEETKEKSNTKKGFVARMLRR
jgi:flagellar basal body P-ring protein FlgI